MIKSIILSIVFFAAIGVHGGVRAQIIPYDSLAVDTVLAASLTDDPQNVKGLPDGNQSAVHQPTGLLGVEFFVNGFPLKLQKGATLHFYWIKEITDSCGALITFIHLPDADNPNYGIIDTALVMEGGPIDQPEAITTLIVPDTSINNISIEVAASEGASVFYIDAIILEQSGLEAVALNYNQSNMLLSSFPNPFPRADGTTVRVSSTAQGIGLLRIYDVLGSEVMHAPLGELTEGERDVKIAIDRPGIFFARLFVNGSPIGGPLRIASE